MKPREVVSLRLSDEEKAAIELAAKREGLRPSEFLRRVGLMVAHRLREASRPEPRPAKAPEPPKDDGPHFTITYPSFEAYRNRGGLTPGPDTAAIAARITEHAG